jgi:hypothetical protein
MVKELQRQTVFPWVEEFSKTIYILPCSYSRGVKNL